MAAFPTKSGLILCSMDGDLARFQGLRREKLLKG